MITLPFGWGTLVVLAVLALIAQTATVAATTMIICRWYTRTERAALGFREDAVTVRENQCTQHEQELDRQATDLYLHGVELGRHAQDLGGQAKVLLHDMRIEDDTTVMMERTENA